MNRIKDFIYDKNDLLIALLIVVAASFLITSRIDTIMAYPATLAAELTTPGGEVVPEVPDTSVLDPTETDTDEDTPDDSIETDPGNEPADPGTDTGGTNTAIGDQTTGEPSVTQVSIYIEYGATGSDIAQLLVDSGLIADKNVFYDAVAAAGADTRLQAGSFKIPSNATPAEIIRIITN